MLTDGNKSTEVMFSLLATVIMSSSPVPPPCKPLQLPEQVCLAAEIKCSDDEELDDVPDRKKHRRKYAVPVSGLRKMAATVLYNSKGCRNH